MNPMATHLPVNPATDAPSLERWRLAAWVANLVAFSLFAVVLVHWGWEWFVPSAPVQPPRAPGNPASVIVASGLFGPSAPGATATAVSAAKSDARLLGVFAESDGKGYAVFRLPSGPRVVRPGEEVTPGATLVAVKPDGVSVREGGNERVWSLRNEPRSTSRAPAPTAQGDAKPQSPASRQVASTVAGKSAGCLPPAGFRGQVVQLNVELLDGLIARPDTWRDVIEPAKDAVVIRDATGFGAMLGLQKGDRVEQANGIALTSADDVVGAVLKPLRANQPVRVSGHRGPDARELWLTNVGCTS